MIRHARALMTALCLSLAVAQTNPVLEFANGDGNPTGNGPVTSAAIRFRTNTGIEVEVLPQPLGTVLTNDAAVAADEVDPDPSDNAASATATVSAQRLEKAVCNLSASECADPADFAASVDGVPGDVLEYRVTCERFGPPVFDLELADDVPPGSVFVTDAFGPGQDVRVTCPDDATVYLATGPVTTVAFDLADVCALDTATRADGITVSEALLPGQAGEFRFRVVIP